MEQAVVSVVDSFEIKPNTPGSQHAPGLVVIFDGRQCAFQLPGVGSAVDLLRPDGVARQAVVGEVKEHGEGRSFFFQGLKCDDAPIGTIVSWQVDTPMKTRGATQTVGAGGV